MVLNEIWAPHSELQPKHVISSTSAKLSSRKYHDFTIKAQQKAPLFPITEHIWTTPLNNPANWAGLVLSIRAVKFPSDCLKTENCSYVTTKMQPVDEWDILFKAGLQQELDNCYSSVVVFFLKQTNSQKENNNEVKRLVLILASRCYQSEASNLETGPCK